MRPSALMCNDLYLIRTGWTCILSLNFPPASQESPIVLPWFGGYEP
jgi:hypothetical protein